MKRILLLIWIGLLFATSIESQVDIIVGGGRFSEEDISEETLFLNAQQKKILGKFDESIDLLKKILAKNEVNAAVHNEMAKVYQLMEDKENAQSSARKAVRYAPENRWFHHTLIDIYEKGEEFDLAAQALAQVIDLAPEERLYHRRGKNFEMAGKREEAISVYKLADQKYGWNAFRSDSMVDLYLELGEEKKAINEVQKWVDREPGNASHLLKLAQFYEYLGRSKDAKKTYEKVLKIDPENEEALVKISQKDGKNNAKGELAEMINDTRIGIDNKIKAMLPLLADENNLERLVPLCASIVDQYPENAKSHALYGDILWLSNDVEGAITSYENSLQISKSVFQVWDQLMMALAVQKNYDKLLELSESALDFYPNQAGPYYYNALALLSTGQSDMAMEMCEEALFISGSPNSYIGEQSIVLKAMILEQGGSGKEAIGMILSLTENERSAAILELLGDLYLKDGDKISAESAWKSAMEKGGDKTRIGLKIQSI